jgi:hypothetical protein
VAGNANSYNCITGQLIGKCIADEYKMTQQPTSGWLIYEWVRLRNFWTFQLRLNGTRSSHLSDNKKLANSLMDLHYLAFLPHVQAIATEDTKLIVPLAKIFGRASLTIKRSHEN